MIYFFCMNKLQNFEMFKLQRIHKQINNDGIELFENNTTSYWKLWQGQLSNEYSITER